jgi:regulator of sirC expression with transglutaminase-like and TPR domain
VAVGRSERIALSTRSEVVRCLEEAGQCTDAEIDLGETALLLAALDCPEVDLAPYRAHLAALAEEASAEVASTASVGLQAAAIRRIFDERHGYQGDRETYDDPRNANLIHVIDRRKGLPVTLGIVLLHLARAYGADLVGLSFPSHFLVRLTARGQRAILDPYDGARTLSAEALRRRLKEMQGPQAEIGPGHFQAAGNRDILIRLQNNIKMRAVSAGDLPRAIEVLGSMTLVAPERSELWWETAVLQTRLGNFNTAISTLESFLAASADAQGRDQLEDLLRRLRSRVN